MSPSKSPIVPAGFVHHPESGCIIPEAELDAHERALSAKHARRSIAPVAAASSAELELERERTKRVAMELELEKLRNERRPLRSLDSRTDAGDTTKEG
jgi:hypothetical protein